MKIKFLILLTISILLGSCAKQNYVHVADVNTKYVRVNKYAAKEDASINAIIAPYKKQVDAKMNEVLGVLAVEMVKSRPNSNLGNWFADVLQDIALEAMGIDVDFAIQNHGGLRVTSVASGDLTVGDIYELMPFDNKLLVLELTGQKTKQLINRIAEYGGWPISNRLSFRISQDKAKDITIRGEKFDINKTYKVAIPDYIANGGDKCYFLEDVDQIDSGKMIRDLLVEHLRKQSKDKPITAPTTLRIK